MTDVNLTLEAKSDLLALLMQRVQPLGCRVRLNRNRRVLLSLRQQKQGGRTLSIHSDLLAHRQAIDDLPQWIQSRGTQRSSSLQEALSAVWHHIHRQQITQHLDLPAIGDTVDLQESLLRIHRTWFARFSAPRIHWARSSPRRKLRHIRFGCYRKGPPAIISINPRLRQPWIASAFLDHVIFHELCHHAIASETRLRHETAHGPRFRQLERQFPHHENAIAWERANLVRLLGNWREIEIS